MVSICSALLTLILGVIVLLGWLLHLPTLIQILPSFVPMQFNTALGFLFIGISLFSLALKKEKLALITATITALIGGLTLIEYLLNINLHIDELFMEHSIGTKTSHPGRMAPNTALCFLLSGLTLAYEIWNKNSKPKITAILASIIFALGFAAFSGYIFSIETAYGWGNLTRMALHTSTGFIILSLGIFYWAKQKSPDSLPSWLSWPITIACSTITVCLWYALRSHEANQKNFFGPSADSSADESVLLFGVLTIIFILFGVLSQKKSVNSANNNFRKNIFPWLTRVIGIILSIYLFAVLQTNAKQAVEARFEGAVQADLKVLRLGEQPYEEVLHQLRLVFESSDNVTRKEFSIVTSRAIETLPGIRAIDYMPRTSHADRINIEKKLSKALGEPRTLLDKGKGGELVKASDRDEYYPLYYVEPFEEARSALGYDIAGYPEQYAALKKSVALDRPVSSPPVHPVQNPNGDLHMVVALPIYNTAEKLDLVEDRWKHLAGFVQMVIEVGPLIDSTLERHDHPAGLNLTFEDISTDGQPVTIFQHLSRVAQTPLGQEQSPLVKYEQFDFIGRDWKVTAKAANTIVFPNWDPTGILMPLMTLLLSLAISSFIKKSSLREEELQRLSADAESSQKKLSALFEALPIGVVMIAKDGKIEEANRITENVLGISNDEHKMRKLQSKSWDILRADESPMPIEEYPATRALNGEKNIKDIEMGIKRPQGDLVWISSSAAAIETEEGGVAVAFQDITTRKLADAEFRENRRRLQTILDNIPCMVLLKDQDGRHMLVNNYYEKARGVKPEDIIGKTDREVHPPEIAESITKRDREIMNSAEVQSYEEEFHHIDGSIHQYMVTKVPLFDDNHQVVGLCGIGTDVSEIQKAKLAIEKNEERFRSLTNNVQGVIYRGKLDKRFTMIYLNPFFKNLTGYNPEEFIGEESPKAFTDIIHQEDLEGIFSIVENAIKNNDSYTLQYRIIHKGGDIRHVYEQGHASFEHVDDDGDDLPDYLDGFIVDVTERKKSEEALALAKDEAEAATRAKGDFLANMSHEIRTPMNAIIGLSHLALNTELNRKQRDYLSKISAASNNLLGIINDILDFSKIEAGKLDMESIPFDLSETLDNLANVVAVKAAEKELEFIVDLGQDVPLNLKGDPLRLNQILINLANNSVKFTEEGEIEIKVERLPDIEDKTALKFSVRDTGIGMTDAQTKKLFQAFSQADTSTTRKFGGTGLGLTISKSLVEMMSGEIGVDSVPEKGSTFHFTALFEPCEETPVRRKLAIPSELKNMSVLVVDDNSTSRTIFTRYLSSFDFKAHDLESGELALEYLQNHEVDLILMDWKMPGLNGLDTVRRIHADDKITKKPQIILVSAYGREELRDEAHHLGIDTYLVKPVNPSTLLDAILETFGEDVEQTTVMHMPDEEIGTFNGLHLLLVEDNEINQQVAEEILSDRRIQVTIANNGQEGVNTLLKTPNAFAGILMDIQMPIMDGYTAAKTIRRDQAFKDLPIIAMTANAMAGDRERALEAGMNDHVAKPIDVKELFSVIKKYFKAEHSETVKQSEEQTIIECPTIEGIDTQDGLTRVAGKVDLYLKILDKFKTSQHDCLERIKSYFESQDYESAEREAHTLKGVAGNIGAKALQEAAKVVEFSLKEQSLNESDCLSLEVELKKIIDALNKLDGHSDSQTESTEELNDAEIQEKINALKTLLSEDDADAIDMLADIKTHLPGDLVRKLSSHLDRYEFEEALELLEDD